MRRSMIAFTVMALLVTFVATGSAVKPDKPPKPGAALTVTKTAAGHWTQTYEWTIDKTVADDTLTMSGGVPAVADYTVTVTKTGPVDMFLVDGEICVTNTGDRETDLLVITDTVLYKAGGKGKPLTLTSQPIDTSAMPTLAAGASYCYPYTVVFTPVPGAAYFNEADVAAGTGQGKNGTTTVKTDFALPTAPDTTVNGTVNVDDTVTGGGDTQSFEFTGSGSVNYQRIYTSAGSYTNTATIRGTGLTATATVSIMATELVWSTSPLISRPLGSLDTWIGVWPDLLIGDDGKPVIAYRDFASFDGLEILQCADSVCSTTASTTYIEPGGFYSSAALGQDGLPVVAHFYRIYASEQHSLSVVHCGDAGCTSGNTTTIADNQLGFGASIPERDVALAIGSDGLPIVSYTNGPLRVIHCDDLTCSTGTTVTVDSTDAGDVSMTIGGDGLPIIAYMAPFGDLRVAHCLNLDCSSALTRTVVSTGSVGLYNSIAVGDDGLPIISFSDLGNSALTVIHCGNLACSSGVSSATYGLGITRGTSIVVRPDGRPLIAAGVEGPVYALQLIDCGDPHCSIAASQVSVIDAVHTTFVDMELGTDGLPIVVYFYDDASSRGLRIAKQIAVPTA